MSYGVRLITSMPSKRSLLCIHYINGSGGIIVSYFRCEGKHIGRGNFTPLVSWWCFLSDLTATKIIEIWITVLDLGLSFSLPSANISFTGQFFKSLENRDHVSYFKQKYRELGAYKILAGLRKQIWGGAPGMPPGQQNCPAKGPAKLP